MSWSELTAIGVDLEQLRWLERLERNDLTSVMLLRLLFRVQSPLFWLAQVSTQCRPSQISSGISVSTFSLPAKHCLEAATQLTSLGTRLQLDILDDIKSLKRRHPRVDSHFLSCRYTETLSPLGAHSHRDSDANNCTRANLALIPFDVSAYNSYHLLISMHHA